METLINVGQRIRWVAGQMIECNATTLDNLRKDLGCSKADFDVFLRGGVDPESETLLKLGCLYNANTEWILDGQNEPFHETGASGNALPDGLPGVRRIDDTIDSIPPEEQQKALEKAEALLTAKGTGAMIIAMLVKSYYAALETTRENDKFRLELIAKDEALKEIIKKLEEKEG